jgi:hypothetical protein
MDDALKPIGDNSEPYEPLIPWVDEKPTAEVAAAFVPLTIDEEPEMQAPEPTEKALDMAFAEDALFVASYEPAPSPVVRRGPSIGEQIVSLVVGAVGLFLLFVLIALVIGLGISAVSGFVGLFSKGKGKS